MSLMLDNEVALGNDSRYKNFVLTIEKTLKQFDATTEWADHITNLSKLKKIIETHSQYKSIPKRITLSKYLAQCLHPALPSGVHSKALEVYEAIFCTIDKCDLQRDIILYTPGLFSLLSVTSLPNKPILLNIYETYLLPLGDALNPVLKCFLVGLFSAIEDGEEHTHRVILLLDKLANRIDEFYFYHCIWSSVDFVSKIRYAAIEFVLNHCDKRKTIEDQIYFAGLSVDTMVSAICTCLQDSLQPLVQRVILNFLLVCLPMHKKSLTTENMIRIIRCTLPILLQRDMSLNRRIYAWFLSENTLDSDITNENGELFDDPVDHSLYFITNTRDILVESLRYSLALISTQSTSSIDQNDKSTSNTIDLFLSSKLTLIKLIRILAVLKSIFSHNRLSFYIVVDKTDVGPNIIEHIFIDYSILVYEQTYSSSKGIPSDNNQQDKQSIETLKVFNMVLDTLEPYFIWECLTKNVNLILSRPSDHQSHPTLSYTTEQICGVIEMLLDICSTENSLDLQLEHVCEMFYRLITIVNMNIEHTTANQLISCVDLLLKIFKIITSSNDNRNLYIFRHSRHAHSEIFDDDNPMSIYIKLTSTDTETVNDIQRLLRQMVYKVEQQIDTSNNSSVESRVSTKRKSEHMNYLEKSIVLYKTLFHRFIITYLIDSTPNLVNNKFQNIYSIIQNNVNSNLSAIYDRYQQLNEFELKLHDNADLYITTFQNCAKLLAEFCRFPMSTYSNDRTCLMEDDINFDDWSIDLCILSIARYDRFKLRTAAVSILIELFGYTLNFNGKNELTDCMENHHLTISSFTRQQVLFLINKTNFFQYIVAYLWECLNDKYDRDTNAKSSNLLALLHSMLPNDLCEDLICNQLLYAKSHHFDNDVNSLDEYKKFFKLWNLYRDFPSLMSERITKSFQHSLIFTFQMLKESNNHQLKSTIEQWTHDCFINGDMCRIFDILLIMLLRPDTKRINIQRFDPDVHREFFIDRQHSKNDQLINSLQDWNARGFSSICDTENNEDYEDDYIDDDKIQDSDMDNDRQIRTVQITSLTESITSVKSSPLITKSQTSSSRSQIFLSSIRLLSPPVLIKSVKQHATTISIIPNRSSIQYDANNHSPQMYSPISNIPSSFQSQSVPTNDVINDSNISLVNHSKDPPYLHILLYTQAYNHTHVELSLVTIDHLFSRFPRQLIQTLLLTSNSQSASISMHNEEMHELYVKHRWSIEGNDFYLSNEINQEYQSYMYILLNILLTYIQSYYPKCFDTEKNCRTQIDCLVLLTRICHDLAYICMDNDILTTYVANLLKKVSFQNIVLCLFDRLVNKESDFYKVNVFHDYNRLTKEYLKRLVGLLEEIILLESIIYVYDVNLIKQLIIHQNIFSSNILKYLKQHDFMEIHDCILDFVVRILPYCGSTLKTVTVQCTDQICRNLITMADNSEETKIQFGQPSSFGPTDYIIRLIQGLSHICNYCLGNANLSAQQFNQILCPQYWMKKIKTNANDMSTVRRLILTKLPLMLSSFLLIWKSISMADVSSIWLNHHIKIIREKIIDSIASITKSNGVSLMRAIILCWGERKQQANKDVRDELQVLTDILLSINHYSINDIINHMNLFIQNLSRTNNKRKYAYICWCLQFLLNYLEQQKNVSIDCWPASSLMFKECLSQSMSPSTTFLLTRILSFYIKHSPLMVDKRDLKDLQDVIMRVLENGNIIVASSLEQTNWLRKNFQVRLVLSDSVGQQTINGSHNEVERISPHESPSLDIDDAFQSANFSLVALATLAEHSETLINIVYNSTDEKDRVIGPYLQNLINNVMPYVRIHSSWNAPSYRSASTLLMNLSQYPYIRKIWKKDIFDQLFDVKFFQVDLPILKLWKTIISNMMNDEKLTSFQDVLSRIKTAQTGLLISKEQEYEQRAMLIKRFAFVIYALEKDQCNRHLPDMLECVHDILKLPQTPVLHIQLFLFFRILLIRVSNKNLISFWPIIIAELVQIFLQIEQELSVNTGGDNISNVQQMTVNDITLSNLSNGSLDSNSSLKMYLYACKSLDILLAMPYSQLHYFQLIRSAFVADRDIASSSRSTFIAFSDRLFHLIKHKLQSMPTFISDQLPKIQSSKHPLLRLRTISNIIELFPFFHCLINTHSNDNDSYVQSQQTLSSDTLNDIETSVLEDFVESWSN